jgi:hypothetical protein
MEPLRDRRCATQTSIWHNKHLHQINQVVLKIVLSE